MADSKEQKIEIFTEILESGKLGAYQNLPFQSTAIQSDNPSFVWNYSS